MPAYSHVYYMGGSALSLETTLSIRNTHSERDVYISSVKYFDTAGEPVKTQLDQLIKLAPMQTIEFLVERRDSSGGSGANFMVEWNGSDTSQRPLVEAVMVGTVGSQGISFARRGISVSD